jgi:hypothetical protein
LAPGQVITLFVRGLNASDATASGSPLPTTLSGITVRVKSGISNYPDRLPILSIRSYDFCAGRLSVPCPLTHVTVQIPNDPVCVPSSPLPNECSIPSAVVTLTIEENGAPGQEFLVVVSGSSRPQVLNGCQTIFAGSGGICYPFVTHADGSRVTGNNPAKPGETIVIYLTGLGWTEPTVKTGEAAAIPAKAVLSFPLVISYRLDLPPASPAPPVVWAPEERWVDPSFVGLVPGYVGLYQMNVPLPTRLPQRIAPCGGGDFGANTRIAIGAGDLGAAAGTAFVDVCVQP